MASYVNSFAFAANVNLLFMAVEMETYCNFSNVEKPINTSITIIELVQYKFKLKQIALYDVYGV